MSSWMLRIELESWWHVGSGRGDGPDADAVVARTPESLPWVPGRTLKGLLRDAAEWSEEVGQLPQGTADRWFGSSPDAGEDGEMARFRTESGSLLVDSAEVGETDEERAQWRAWAKSHPADVRHFSQVLGSTAMDKGVAQRHTLRRVEVVLPLVLHARLSSVSDGSAAEEDRRLLEKAVLPLVRHLGTRRNRGMGRCRLALEGGA